MFSAILMTIFLDIRPPAFPDLKQRPEVAPTCMLAHDVLHDAGAEVEYLTDMANKLDDPVRRTIVIEQVLALHNLRLNAYGWYTANCPEEGDTQQSPAE